MLPVLETEGRGFLPVLVIVFEISHFSVLVESSFRGICALNLVIFSYCSCYAVVCIQLRAHHGHNVWRMHFISFSNICEHNCMVGCCPSKDWYPPKEWKHKSCQCASGIHRLCLSTGPATTRRCHLMQNHTTTLPLATLLVLRSWVSCIFFAGKTYGLPIHLTGGNR